MVIDKVLLNCRCLVRRLLENSIKYVSKHLSSFESNLLNRDFFGDLSTKEFLSVIGILVPLFYLRAKIAIF